MVIVKLCIVSFVASLIDFISVTVGKCKTGVCNLSVGRSFPCEMFSMY